MGDRIDPVKSQAKLSEVNKWFLALPLIGGALFPVVRVLARDFYADTAAKRLKGLKIAGIGAAAVFGVKFGVAMMYPTVFSRFSAFCRLCPCPFQQLPSFVVIFVGKLTIFIIEEALGV